MLRCRGQHTPPTCSWNFDFVLKAQGSASRMDPHAPWPACATIINPTLLHLCQAQGPSPPSLLEAMPSSVQSIRLLPLPDGKAATHENAEERQASALLAAAFKLSMNPLETSTCTAKDRRLAERQVR